MINPNSFGKIFIMMGCVFIFFGLIFLILPKAHRLGHLPGDIYIQKKNFIFYFPLASAILISSIISFLIWIFLKK
ncbi:MAG: DUF2905 domain-containing protein [Candidatus Omnitrophica bacterium]|nr:DUF2905 domain-containing protein [Candidatus Omnitrophota bacterium]MBU1924452.1 DUF2905 domain-containing protein [Candidatus Omnitrophota bacterium]